VADVASLTVKTGPDQGFEIVLPADPKPLFGRTRAPVVVEVNGYRYRSTIAAMGGGWFVPLRRSHREAAGLDPDRSYTVTLTLDTEPRTVDPPADLLEAIREAGLEQAWTRLSYTAQREAAEAVEGAKKPETRTRRIAACVDRLAKDQRVGTGSAPVQS
jgi:hypothetical protein